jgi:predicted SAM-dependent methyltransferase
LAPAHIRVERRDRLFFLRKVLRMLESRNILDLGCGNRKRPGAIGIDRNPRTDADIVHDLDKFPYPFADSSFDEIYIDNVLEHLHDIIKVMEELHRISKPGGLVKIIVPYFRAKWAFIDPTHKHFFTIDSFSYFDPGHIHNTLYNYSKATFKVDKIIFNEDIRHTGLLRTMTAPIKAFANRWPTPYETVLSHLFPLDTVSFYLRALK